FIIRIFLTIPVATCSSERSFFVFRRLKTYLRSTTSQLRLNHLAIVHCYKERAHNLSIEDLYKEFTSR
ncbi:hypothetical protein HELRODRAFT_153340, partial [Helobdella robusta]|uniref:HAT C-terminal dimerisation domain-containing protein n=1 Tax=Helobdella robusta TaxID=6412 RepID=T1EL44_HELRO